jgi:hypothetical protein
MYLRGLHHTGETSGITGAASVIYVYMTGMAGGVLTSRFSAPATRHSDPFATSAKDPWKLPRSDQGFLFC